MSQGSPSPLQVYSPAPAQPPIFPNTGRNGPYGCPASPLPFNRNATPIRYLTAEEIHEQTNNSFVRSLPETYNALYEKACNEESKQWDKEYSVLDALAKGKSWFLAIDELHVGHYIALSDYLDLRRACTPFAFAFELGPFYDKNQEKPEAIAKALVRINEKLKNFPSHHAAQIQRALI